MNIIEKFEHLLATDKPERFVVTKEEFEEYVNLSLHMQPVTISPASLEMTWDERTYKGIPIQLVETGTEELS